MTYPPTSEAGPWTDTLTPVQRAVYEKLQDSNISDWPPRFYDLVRAIVTDWAGGISSDVLMEAIACAVHHDVHGTSCPQDLADFMAGREEMAG
jgi:hypothetical protein